MSTFNLIAILGPTASGKTRVAACLAERIGGEVISADSRQVYRGMDLGTGKDMADYRVGGRTVPCHLVDIVDPGYEYNVYEYQRDFKRAFLDIQSRKIMPVLCGGSGLYIEAVLKGYRLIHVPGNEKLRKELEHKSMEEMRDMLSAYKELHNITDTGNRKRLVRALEIGAYYSVHPEIRTDMPELNALVVGIQYDRETRRRRITERLQQRLDDGMIRETEVLVQSGLSYEQLMYYGLEYKYIAMHLRRDISYEEMFTRLNTAIHQFSKRQLTWFRGMERRGIPIRWLDGCLPMEEKLERIMAWLVQ